MQIACPHCATTYDLAPTAIGPEGRSVRCARCKEVWHAMPVAQNAAPSMAHAHSHDDAAHDEHDMAAAMARDEFARHDEMPQIDSPSISADGEAGNENWNEAGQTIDAAAAPPSASFGRKPKIRGKVESLLGPVMERIKPHVPAFLRKSLPMPKWLSKIGYAGVNVALAALCAGILIWRTDIVRAMPQTAAFYEAIGMGVNLRGLAFSEAAMNIEHVDGMPVLLIEGTIVGIARKAVELPRLRFGVFDAKGVEIFNWTATLDQPYLKPGDTAWFKTRLAAPPIEARSILVRFYGRGDMMPGAAKPGRG
jgi:predicted Zn finger-like uncharacterized protein